MDTVRCGGEQLEDRTLLAISQVATGSVFNSDTLASFAVPAGNDRLLVVATVSNGGAPGSVSYGTTMLTNQGTGIFDLGQLWTVPLGSGAMTTFDITAPGIPNSGSSNEAIAAVVFAGVDQATPIDGAVVSSGFGIANRTVNVTSEVGDLSLALIGTFNGSFNEVASQVGAGQTEIFNSHPLAVISNQSGYSLSTKLGEASTTLSVSAESYVSAIHVAFNINAAATSFGFTVTESGGSTSVSESGGTDTFDVVLDSQPATDVVIDISSGDTGEATVSTS